MRRSYQKVPIGNLQRGPFASWENLSELLSIRKFLV